jgi:Xaa-Pro aminopeptidase
LERAREAAAGTGLLIAPGSDLRYLIGQAGGSFERLTTLVIPADGAPALVVPKLEAPGFADVPLEQLGVEVVTWVDGDDPYAVAADRLRGSDRVAVSDFTPALHVLALREALPKAEQRLAGPIVRELRMRKDTAEIEALRKAGAAIDRVHARVGEWLRPRRSARAHITRCRTA